jgi:hypothetical protein
LTPAQIAGWDALAAAPPEADYNSLGELIYLSGSAWYVRVNMRRLEVGQMISDPAPPSVAVSPPTAFTLDVTDFDDPTPTDTFDYGNNDFVGAYARLYLSMSVSGVRQVQTRGYNVTWAAVVPPIGPQDISAELRTVFGWLSGGQKVFGKLRVQSQQGIQSTDLLADTVVKEYP